MKSVTPSRVLPAWVRGELWLIAEREKLKFKATPVAGRDQVDIVVSGPAKGTIPGFSATITVDMKSDWSDLAYEVPGGIEDEVRYRWENYYGC